jgi:lipoprotein-anchoring transpeptidase ErfK/SrfK
MNTPFDEARSAVQKARQALHQGDRTEARRWAEQAASLAPQMEDAWLVLAAVANPRASVEYLQKALSINPNSPRARRGMEWAMQRLPKKPGEQGSGNGTDPKRSPLYPVLILGLGLLVCAIAAWSAAASPAVASFVEKPGPGSLPTHPPSWAQAPIPKPTYTPRPLLADTDIFPATSTPAFVPTDAPVFIPSDAPTDLPTEMALIVPTDTTIPGPEPTWSGSLSLEYVPDTPTAAIPTPGPAPTYASQMDRASGGGEHWIDVNLSQQMVYAYEGDTVVNSFLVSTGTWQTPTVTGRYHIYVKLRSTDMAGPGYYLPDVPYTMYFYQGYGLHGTYWHHNFGTPMSHGCVNLSTPDAEWLYDFASVGTLVNVHY